MPTLTASNTIKGIPMKSSVSVANKLLELAKDNGATLTPMQLIKLVFLCHGWMLGLYGRHLVKDSIEAWRYGPVIPDLYQKIKRFKSFPVDYPISNDKNEIFDEDEISVIRQVYDMYGKYSGIELSTITHAPASPWEITWNDRRYNGSLISNDLIEFYYRQQVKQ